jgi:hypothetical protein
VTLNYAGRCERYARQRGWPYSPTRMSVSYLTPKQFRRAMKKERHAMRKDHLAWVAVGL